MQHSNNPGDDGTLSQFFQSSKGNPSHENGSTSETVAFGHADVPSNASNTSNITLKNSDREVSDETLLEGENEHILSGHRRSPAPRWSEIGRGRGLWVWEIIGAALSLSCIVSLLMLLVHLDQSPLATWRFVMAPNTTISTFITFAKASMLLAVGAGISQLKWVHFAYTKRQISDLDIFDEASRGPWGASKFIWRMKGRSLLTSLGAFIVVVSLAMEPFAQQILSFETRSVVSPNGFAHVSMAHSYHDPLSSQILADPKFREAFMMGVLRYPFQWSFQCSTGNCSWPDFTALGICFSCANVTSSSRKRVVVEQAVNTSDGEWGTDIRSIHYKTPTGLELKVCAGGEISWKEYGNTTGGTRGRTSLVTGSALATQDSDRSLRDPVIAVVAISLSFRLHDTIEAYGRQDGGYLYDFAPPDITECRISWCARRYRNLEASNGAITPALVETVEIPSQDVSDYQQYCLKQYFHYKLSANPKTNGEENTSFIVSCMDHVHMSDVLTMALNFNGFQEDDGSAFNNYISLRLLSRPNVTALFEDITESLTQHIQTGPNSTLHNGTANVSEIHIIVHWPWAILPALVVIVGVVFLGVIIFVNNQSDVRLWKSSLNPLVFHGLDGWELDGADVDTVGGMEKLAMEMKTQLARNEQGRLKLVHA